MINNHQSRKPMVDVSHLSITFYLFYPAPTSVAFPLDAESDFTTGLIKLELALKTKTQMVVEGEKTGRKAASDGSSFDRNQRIYKHRTKVTISLQKGQQSYTSFNHGEHRIIPYYTCHPIRWQTSALAQHIPDHCHIQAPGAGNVDY